MVTCSVEGCDRPVRTRSLCNKHYQRWWTHGDPLIVLKDMAERGAPQEFIEMALNYQDEETCLHWPFARDQNGYAHLFGERAEGSRYVSRIVCEKVHGSPPTPKHQAAHSCGKGHLGCINPHHLEWKTPKGNTEEKRIHGTDGRGEQGSNAKLNWEKVKEIKAMKGIMSGSEVAAIYGVNSGTIYYIWSGKTWKE